MNVYWIPAAGLRLAIVSRPRGGDWLPDDVAVLKRAGFDAVVSALTPPENEELGLLEEGLRCREAGLEFLDFPVADRSVPASRESFAMLIGSITGLLKAGKAVAVHCRAGIGRSSLIAAATLVSDGVPPDSAFRAIAEARGCPVPDTPEQKKWLEDGASLAGPNGPWI